jgi:hypothetical protein
LEQVELVDLTALAMQQRVTIHLLLDTQQQLVEVEEKFLAVAQ